MDKLILMFLVSLLFALTAGATFTNLVPAESLEEPQGVSLREESVRGGHFFVSYRTHQGGGLSGGK